MTNRIGVGVDVHELAGIVVTTVEGSVESFKITTPFDLEMAQSFMNRK